MGDMIDRDAVAKAFATLSQEFLDGGSPTAVKVLNLAMDRIRAIPAADARAEALKEALQALRGAGSFGRTAAEKHAALEQYCLCRDAILALIPETKP